MVAVRPATMQPTIVRDLRVYARRTSAIMHGTAIMARMMVSVDGQGWKVEIVCFQAGYHKYPECLSLLPAAPNGACSIMDYVCKSQSH